MQSNYEFSNDELLEETFIKDSSTKEIITWLRNNHIKTQNNLKRPLDDFVKLRKKYEPIWAEKDPRLKLAICSYGKNIRTLRKIFFSNSSQNFKIAILQNGYFASHILPYNEVSLSSLTKEEIIKIYENEKIEKRLYDGLFYYIFSNPWIDETTIFSLFNRDEEFRKINKDHLQKIFSLMMLNINSKEVNFFKINKYYDYTFIIFLDNLLKLILEVDISKKPDFLYYLESLLKVLRQNGYKGSFNIDKTKLEKFLSRRKIGKYSTPEIVIMDDEVICNILNLIEVKSRQNSQTQQLEIKDLKETTSKIFAQNKILINRNSEYEKKFEQLQNNLLEISIKIASLEPKFDNIFDKIKKEELESFNRYHNLYEKIDQPNDFFSKILLKIPIFNRIFRILIK